MIYILTGPVHSGKTTLLKKLSCELKKQKVRIDGFLSEVVLKNHKVIGYDLFSLREEKSIPFIRRTGDEEWEKVSSYFFIPESQTEANRVILGGRDSDIFFLDEIGPLELAGKGFWPALRQVIFKPLTKYLLVVRINILKDFLEVLNQSNIIVFDIKNSEIFPQMIKEIKKTVLINENS